MKNIEIKAKTTKVNFLIYSLLKFARFDTNTVEFNKIKTKLINIIKPKKINEKYKLSIIYEEYNNASFK